jgi:outer membrane biosynthesis protein TonB
MKSRSLLTLGLLSLLPAAVFAQTPPEPPEPLTPQVPAAPAKPARPVTQTAAPAPALPAVPPQSPKPAPAPAPPAAPVAPALAVAPVPRPLGQLLNVQVEVTLSDSKGTPKTVVLTVADGEMGQNRTSSGVLLAASQLAPAGTYKNFTFNADARPNVAGNKIRLSLTAEAEVPAIDAKAGSAANINLRQSQTLILNDGDSVEIARASDPVSDRTFVLSVKVKIQR